MASGRRRRRRRRLRGALGGEARPLGSHQPRGGEEGAGASLGPARITCPKHVHVTRAPRPSRWPMRGDVGSSVRGDCCSHPSRLLGRLTPPGTAPSPRGAVSSGPLPSPLGGAAAASQSGHPIRIRWLPLSCQPSINRLLATDLQLSVNLSVRRRSAASLRSYVPWFHSFV